MDIKKEREAFESVFTETRGWDLTFIMGCYQNIETLRAFAGWQAAKAQAVPEGFVLVDKHQLAQLMANMDSFGKKALGDDYVSFADIAEVLDEAQEQSHECQNP